MGVLTTPERAAWNAVTTQPLGLNSRGAGDGFRDEFIPSLLPVFGHMLESVAHCDFPVERLVRFGGGDGLRPRRKRP